MFGHAAVLDRLRFHGPQTILDTEGRFWRLVGARVIHRPFNILWPTTIDDRLVGLRVDAEGKPVASELDIFDEHRDVIIYGGPPELAIRFPLTVGTMLDMLAAGYKPDDKRRSRWACRQVVDSVLYFNLLPRNIAAELWLLGDEHMHEIEEYAGFGTYLTYAFDIHFLGNRERLRKTLETYLWTMFHMRLAEQAPSTG